MVISKREINGSPKTRIPSTEIFTLCPVEYLNCHPLRAAGIGNDYHRRLLLSAFGSVNKVLR